MHGHMIQKLVVWRWAYNLDADLGADSLRRSSVNFGTLQRGLAWPLREVDAHTSRSVIIFSGADLGGSL